MIEHPKVILVRVPFYAGHSRAIEDGENSGEPMAGFARYVLDATREAERAVLNTEILRARRERDEVCTKLFAPWTEAQKAAVRKVVDDMMWLDGTSPEIVRAIEAAVKGAV